MPGHKELTRPKPMDKPIPSVSVIIPSLNRASLLKRSIDSVLAQTYQDFEIIVVDDASTDNTEEVVHGIGDPRIRYFKHERNSGGSAARNTGIREARGKFIAFQDSDDVWLPEKLAKQMTILQDSTSKVGVVYTGFWRFQGDNKEYIPGPEIQVKVGGIHRELLLGNFVGTPTVVIKRECFQKTGMFDEDMPRLQDWELFIRVAKYYEFLYVPEPLVHSYFVEGSISSQQKALIRASEIILDKFREDYEANPFIYYRRLLDLSALYRQEENIRKTRSYLTAAVKVHPRPLLLLTFFVSWLGLKPLNLFLKLVQKGA